MVVDTSVVLSILFDEVHADWAQNQIEEYSGRLRMSTVNLAETLIHLRDRQPQLAEELEDDLLTSGIRFVAPDLEQARLAATARLRWPINLGDCFAYALAIREESPILTLDADFLRVDCPLIMPESGPAPGEHPVTPGS